MYKGSQLQRKIETAIRNQKDIANIAKAAGNDELRREAQEKINLLTNKYAVLSTASGLPTKMERLQVKGFRAVKVNVTEKGISGKRKYNTIENRVDIGYIKSKDYKKKFEGLPFEPKVNQSIYEQAKAILIHRNGTYFEDIYLVDSKTGKVLSRSYNNTTENEVSYTKLAKKTIKENPHSLISIHNHGTNNPPTGSDFVSAGRRQYKNGIVVCHSGDVYLYNVGKKPFSSTTFSKMVDNFVGKGYNEKEAIKQTLMYYSEKYGIEWRLL